MSKKFLIACLTAVAIGAAAGFAMPADAAGVKVGVLTCHVSSGWGFVFGSSKSMRCSYRPNNGHNEHYTGDVGKFGIDLGYSESSVIIWGVVAPTSDLKAGALEGKYVGVQASASIGVGGGANALIGGFDKSITLQPLSIEGDKGLNVAAGIGAMTLKYAP